MKSGGCAVRIQEPTERARVYIIQGLLEQGFCSGGNFQDSNCRGEADSAEGGTGKKPGPGKG